MAMLRTQRHTLEDFSEAELRAVVMLVNDIWPRPGKSIDQLVEKFPKQRGPEVKREFIIVWDDNEAIAHAEIFPRGIETTEGSLEILALAGVCVSRKRRNEGFGRTVVEKAFAQVDRERYEASLFQTDIPSFYERLGAKRVTNKFFNSLNRDEPYTNPWWDHYVMVYPATIEWPEGEMDLKGPGY